MTKLLTLNENHVPKFPRHAKLRYDQARKKWIISSIGSNGKIHIDNGASNALRNGKSLLPAGIIKVEGSFLKGDNMPSN